MILILLLVLVSVVSNLKKLYIDITHSPIIDNELNIPTVSEIEDKF